MASRRGSLRKVAGVVLVPGMLLALLLGVTLTASTTHAACGPTGAALAVDPATVPPGPVAGYTHAQLVNAAQIMLAAQRLGLSARDQQIGVMTAMGESGLEVLDHGDAVGPDSRGLFQQRASWGSHQARMDPFTSATNFFRAEQKITGRVSMEPTLIANAVQNNADPYHYRRYWEPAGAVVSALGGIKPNLQKSSTNPTSPANVSRYSLGPVQPQTAAVANTVGPMFGIKTVGGYRDPGSEKYDPNGHPAGLALDFMINDIPRGAEVGDHLAAYLQDHASEIGVRYIIWKQRIWSTPRADEGWRPMEDRGSATQNHMDHVHLSLSGSLGALPDCPNEGVPGTVNTAGWASPAQGAITSKFGPRNSPGGIGSTYHRGIDIAGPCDGPIWSVKDGQVVQAGPVGGYGNLIEIDHGEDVHTRYGHMYADGILVHVGDQVHAGQQIARIGSAGNSTGCHLHFEILLDGRQVDPEQLLHNVMATQKHGQF